MMISLLDRVENTVEKGEYAGYQSGLCSKVLMTISKSLEEGINSLPNNKILDWSKFKAFADDNVNVNKELKFDMGRVENIVGKEENAGYQHFLLYPQCFKSLLPQDC